MNKLIQKLYNGKISIEATCIRCTLCASVGTTYSCHALTYQGGKLDPDMDDKVGMYTDHGKEEIFQLYDENFEWRIKKNGKWKRN